jgi:hypothetical protein
MNAILHSISESFEGEETEQSEDKTKVLTPGESARIEQLALKLERKESMPSGSCSESGNLSDDRPNDTPPSDSEAFTSSSATDAMVISMKVTMPETVVTLINDLQGLDEALVRIKLVNMMTGAQVRNNDPAPYTCFDFHGHSSVLADYFDAPNNRWRPLLLKSWEISTKGFRGPCSTRFESNRPSTSLDIESFPCHVSLSEQFLASIASAHKMWSIYSTATNSAFESGVSSQLGPKLQKQLRKSTAASAARTLITSLPYAVENHTGMVVEFVVHGEDEKRFSCESGSLEYFQFSPPKGAGSGGKRLYGEDVSFKKSLTLYVEESHIFLSDLDSHICAPEKVIETSTSLVIASVAREGKTVVSSYLFVSLYLLPFGADISVQRRYYIFLVESTSIIARLCPFLFPWLTRTRLSLLERAIQAVGNTSLCRVGH